MKALCFELFGDAEVLLYKELPDPVIGEREILVRMKAIGLNFADIYRRRGNYHLKGNPPYILGYEGAGTVEQVGKSVTAFQIGDRVAFADVPHANAELVAVPEDHAVPIPGDISFETAASLLLQGWTAHYLTQDSYKVIEGTQVLIHAAAGGVGQLLSQICKLRGAYVVGLTSTPAKREVALKAGADKVLLYAEHWVEKADLLTREQKGFDVVYDSVGSTLEESFLATKIGGTVVFYGMSGGDPQSIDPRMLMDGSKTLTGGDLWNYLTSHMERVTRANELFEWLRTKQLRLAAPTLYKLSEGAEAHRYMESRHSTGKILLIP
ncbi:quinone oxidoreductase [Paenibacillus psychroresistens]|uniref:Quinone oxidoreductase n=1 Tax=Paenibacillus psychroresistens TaxID=1778678 RepID=A0A6B8RGI1_9BACL|nr:quinone oxidoreductase [Paenibacillus psychroresistens]QGQ94633.1 quinone oxidoreductase [Paenibacillus psychroresistens]